MRTEAVEKQNTQRQMLGKAVKLQNNGELQRAEILYQNILEKNPYSAVAHNNLGMLLVDAGQVERGITLINNAAILWKKNRPELAEGAYKRILAVDKNNLAAWNDLGNLYKKQSQFNLARFCYATVIKKDPHMAEPYFNMGRALLEDKKYNKSIPYFKRALQINNTIHHAHNNLGFALYKTEAYKGAIAACRKAIELKPDYANPHLNLGLIYKELGDFDIAETYIQKAIDIHPERVAGYRQLMNLHHDLGDFENVRKCRDRVLELEPDDPMAFSTFAFVEKMTDSNKGWYEKAVRLVKESRLKDRERAQLCFALGKYCDDTADFAMGFQHYQKGNEIRKKNEEPFDYKKHGNAVDFMIKTYGKRFFDTLDATVSKDSRPVFIVGMPRSGTSLTEQILSTHSKVYGAGELSFWNNMGKKYLKRLNKGEFSSMDSDKLSRDYSTLLDRKGGTAGKVVDKMPSNYVWLPLILSIYPGAKFIHMKRNPLDTCLSIYFQNFIGKHPYAYDLVDIAKYYKEYERLTDHWKKVVPGSCFINLKYEDLIENQEKSVEKLMDFLKLDWEESCLTFYKTRRRVGTASNWQVRQKIYTSSKERWRNYEAFIQPMIKEFQTDRR